MEKFNMQEARFCEGCDTDICESCAFEALADSRYGDLLRHNPPRFGRWAFEDAQRFIKLVGEDVDPLRHGLYQANAVVIPFVQAQNSTPWRQHFAREEAKMLYIGNILHDAHEGLTGDVPLPEKTLQSDQEEQAVNMAVVAEILGPVATDDFMKAYESIIWDLEGWSFAGRAFKAIELVGYIETGLRAWAAKDHADLDADERARVRDMAKVVLEIDIPMLAPFIKEFAYVFDVHRRASQALADMKK